MAGEADLEIRRAVFDWLTEQRAVRGEVLNWHDLVGFELRGTRIPLIGQRGIWKPRVCSLPISITTVANGPYRDHFDEATRTVSYHYRGDDPESFDNRWLRQVMRDRVPMVYFYGLEGTGYAAAYPVFVIGENVGVRSFDIQVDDVFAWERAASSAAVAEDPEPRRAYVTSVVQRRLHQVAFRERVLRAYRSQCALCRLAHSELLDAAHITPDREEAGDPVVSNGLALCKLHHAAFDGFFFAVTPDYVIEVRKSVLAESDGPMLVVGLQQIHGQRIVLPRHPADRPDVDRLERRYVEFLRAS